MILGTGLGAGLGAGRFGPFRWFKVADGGMASTLSDEGSRNQAAYNTGDGGCRWVLVVLNSECSRKESNLRPPV